MKNLITVLAVALFSAGMNMSAQDTKPKETPKKECTAKKKKHATNLKNHVALQNPQLKRNVINL